MAQGNILGLAHGKIRRLLTRAQIERWWQQWPNANVGIAAGKSGLVCLDLDLYQQGAGELALSCDEQETVTNLTGGGGQHLIYLHPDGAPIGNADHDLPTWVNVRANGGQFVAPPSMHKSGRRYGWKVNYGPSERPFAPLPEKLRTLLQGQPEKQQRLSPAIGETIPEGGRNNALTSLAGTMRRRGMGQEAIEAALLVENLRACDPPLPEAEVRAIAASVARYEPGVAISAPGATAEPAPLTGTGALVNPWLDQLRTLKDAYTERPPLKYLVEGFIAAGGLSMFFGAPGGYKSFILADIAVCVAGGHRWLTLPDGSGGRAVAVCPVLWVDCDNGKRRTDARFEALARARSLPQDTPLLYVSMPDPAPNVADVHGAKLLLDTVKQVGAGLVIIDNLGLITGDIEENSAAMAAVMGNLRSISEATGAAVIVLHHQRKTSDREQQLNIVRGHSSIAASLDLAIHVSRDTEDRRKAVLIPVKERDSAIPIIGAEFSFKDKPDRDDELEAARFFGVNQVDTRSDQAIRWAILEVLYNVTLNKTQLIATLKDAGITAGRPAIERVLASMLQAGELNQTTGERNARLFSLA
jgi:hypothetical protein